MDEKLDETGRGLDGRAPPLGGVQPSTPSIRLANKKRKGPRLSTKSGEARGFVDPAQDEGEGDRIYLRWLKEPRTMRKTQAVRMKPGTLILFEDWRKVMSSGERLGRVEHVTPRGGVLATPVVERFGDNITVEPIGPAVCLPYSKVQLAYPPSRRA